MRRGSLRLEGSSGLGVPGSPAWLGINRSYSRVATVSLTPLPCRRLEHRVAVVWGERMVVSDIRQYKYSLASPSPQDSPTKPDPPRAVHGRNAMWREQRNG